MKKLLFIPLGWELKPNPDLFYAFSKKFETMHYESLVEAILFCPDFIYVQSGAIDVSVIHELKRECGSYVIQWTGDCRPNELLPEVMNYKNVADLTLLVAGIGQKEMYEKALGSPVGYLQQGVFNSFFMKPQLYPNADIVFIGNNYDHFEGAIERTNLCKTLSLTFDEFEVIGNGFNHPEFNNHRSCDYLESAKIYNEAYISISHACFNDVEGYYSNRTIDIMASGGCCLMRRFPNCEDFFTDMKHCVFYSNNEECVDKIKMLFRNPEIRNSIALEGFNFASKFHSFDVRVNQIKNKL